MKLLKKECEICKSKVRKMHRCKNKFVCYSCYSKNTYILNKGVTNPYARLTFEQALNKTYNVKGYKCGNSFRATISVPQILIGHKVKVVIVK